MSVQCRYINITEAKKEPREKDSCGRKERNRIPIYRRARESLRFSHCARRRIVWLRLSLLLLLYYYYIYSPRCLCLCVSLHSVVVVVVVAHQSPFVAAPGSTSPGCKTAGYTADERNSCDWLPTLFLFLFFIFQNSWNDCRPANTIGNNINRRRTEKLFIIIYRPLSSHVSSTTYN